MARGSVKNITAIPKGYEFTIDSASRTQFESLFSHDLLFLSFTVRGSAVKTTSGFIFTPNKLPRLTLNKHFPARSMLQNNTLRMIEKWIYYAENHRYPKTNDDIFWIHEGLLEEYAPKLKNPNTGMEKPKRTSDLNSSEMGWIINGALTTLASQDIPETVLDTIDVDFSELWEEMYRWRYSHKTDPFLDKYDSWEEYKKIHPVCEFSKKIGTTGDPLVRMHIISAGADGTLYEKPWNWIHALQSIHQQQHTEGWASVMELYPHMISKIEKAKELGRHKGVSEWQLPTSNSNQTKSSQLPMF